MALLVGGDQCVSDAVQLQIEEMDLTSAQIAGSIVFGNGTQQFGSGTTNTIYNNTNQYSRTGNSYQWKLALSFFGYGQLRVSADLRSSDSAGTTSLQIRRRQASAWQTQETLQTLTHTGSTYTNKNVTITVLMGSYIEIYLKGSQRTVGKSTVNDTGYFDNLKFETNGNEIPIFFQQGRF